MNFKEISELFENLEKTSKRLNKILILRDFFERNREETPIIFDIISGNYQRRIEKKKIGISLKTIFSVISFVSRTSEVNIEKRFNKLGDVGSLSIEFLHGEKQSSLKTSKLSLEKIKESLEKISRISGNNSNKIKKEILSELFISAQSDLEYKFLSRLLIDDLRIGVSEGTLKETCVNIIFPNIKGIQKECENCKYINLNNEKCFSCNEKLGKEKDEKKEKYLLDETLKINSKTVINSEEPRELYNLFISTFEKKYNVTLSFENIFRELDKDKKSILNSQVILFNPIKSMLGLRAKNAQDAMKISGENSFTDYKYDGLRVQIHNDKGKIELFSRNLDNITKQFPEIVKFIKENFSDLSFVLDTEAVGYNYDKEEFLPFQVLSRRILTKDINTVNHIKIIVKAFDIIFLNGKTLIDDSYSKRRDILESLFLNRELKQDF